MSDPGEVRPLALRIGVAFWLISWIPLAVIFHVQHPGRELIWIGQVVLGVAGIALAGKAFLTMAKAQGWRKSPRLLGSVLIHGRMPVQPPDEAQPV